MRILPLAFLLITSGAAALTATGCGGSTAATKGTGEDSGGGTVVFTPRDAGGAAADATRDASVAHDTGADAGVDAFTGPTDAELNTYPAIKPVVPQVVSSGGPVLASPIFVPVIFAGDAYASQITPFIEAIGQSEYWKAAVGEYGVGPARGTAAIVLNETLPSSLTDSQLQTWLTNRIGTDPRFGAIPGSSLFDAGPFDAGAVDATAPVSDAIAPTAAPPAGTVYAIFVPGGTQVSFSQSQGGGTSCTDFGGYHNSFYYGPDGATVVYAVLPRCGSFGQMSGFDALSGPASHELAEAATDPEVGSPGGAHAAFAQVDLNHIFWELMLGGGEVGDMCAQFPGAFYHPAEASMSTYMVQRIWSNKAAAAGQDPCVPTLAPAQEPYYFNAMPELQAIQAHYQGATLPTLGLQIPVGQSATLTLDLFSTSSTAPNDWQISAVDGNQYLTGGSAGLTFSSGVLSGTNGDKLQLTITNTGADGQSSHPFVIFNSIGVLQDWNWWIGVVSN